MLVIKSQNKADIDEAQRQYWWRKTPGERLAVATRLIAQVRQLYAANSTQAHGERVLKSATPIPRRAR